MGMEEEASAARSAATESLRLTDENTLLGNQLKQMEFNLKVSLAPTRLPILSSFVYVSNRQYTESKVALNA